MDKDKLLKWLLDWRSDVAREISETPSNYVHSHQYLDGINDTLRIVINAVQENDFNFDERDEWNSNLP